MCNLLDLSWEDCIKNKGYRSTFKKIHDHFDGLEEFVEDKYKLAKEIEEVPYYLEQRHVHLIN